MSREIIKKECEMKQIDKRMKCPFYKSTYRNFIYCEGIAEELSGTAAMFDNSHQKNEYIKNFCGCHCWKGCSIAQAIMEKYD